MKTVACSGRWLGKVLLAAVVLLLATAPISAQGGGGFSGGSAGGASGGGGFAGGGISGGGISGGGGGGGISGGSMSGGGISGASTGTTTNRATGTGNSSGPGVQQSDPFSSYYTNPLSLGFNATSGGAAKSVYGKPVYATYTTSSSTSGSLSTGGGGLVFATSYPTRRSVPFITTIGFDYTPRASTTVQAEAQSVLDRSSSLSASAVSVTMVGQVALLQGRVTNDRARRLAESLVRLTPGVKGVQNQLLAVVQP